MNVHMTYGTVSYLSSIRQKHPEKPILILQDGEKGLAYYEGDDSSVFTEGHEYETVDDTGEMQESGFVIMNHIPVTDEGRPIFEDRFKNRAGKIESMPGFQAIRVLRPKQGNTYIVLTQWKDQKSFENWKTSQSFQKAHQHSRNSKGPSFSAGPSYVTSYVMVEPTDV